MYEHCNGKHKLIDVYRCGYVDNSVDVVRWCENCGAVVVDTDYDNHTNAGQVMKMKFPKISEEHIKKTTKL